MVEHETTLIFFGVKILRLDTANTLNKSVFNALSNGSVPVAAVWLCIKREDIYVF